jgi:cyclopropane-fatty-acyl-phospholipid synthase
MTHWIREYAKKMFLRSLQDLEGGFLELVCPEVTYVFGDPAAELRAMAVVHEERFFVRAVTGADVGIGESYMDGDWSSPDLVSLVRLCTRNLRSLDARNPLISGLRRLAARFRHRLRDNNLEGSQKNIRAHYDLGNDFYALFLDQEMQYSAACFSGEGESLEQAQRNKMDLLCRKLQLEPGDRVLEIGCGWGSLAIFAARNYGAEVTGLTISPAQFEYARRKASRADLGRGAVEVLLKDYRELEGRYDKIVSVEMFEAVGLGRYDQFFSACDRLLAPGGSLLLQTITMPERELRDYRRRVDWIQTYIFPGSELAFVGEVQKSLARATSLNLTDLESMGAHYAKTLAHWRERFFRHLGDVQDLGFDQRFQRMWSFYLAWCEGAFQEKYINVMQLLCENSTAPKRSPARLDSAPRAVASF